jgi:hypothetical protein
VSESVLDYFIAQLTTKYLTDSFMLKKMSCVWVGQIFEALKRIIGKSVFEVSSFWHACLFVHMTLLLLIVVFCWSSCAPQSHWRTFASLFSNKACKFDACWSLQSSSSTQGSCWSTSHIQLQERYKLSKHGLSLTHKEHLRAIYVHKCFANQGKSPKMV